MRKTLALLLVLSLFSGCQKKKNLVMTCTTSNITDPFVAGFELFSEITWVIAYDYKELISTSALNTLIFTNENDAEETAEILRNDGQYEEFVIEVDKNIVTTSQKNDEIRKISKEYIDERLTNFETNGFVCELK